MQAGVPPEHPDALAAIDRARLQIDHWFYPCSREMYAQLGQLYISDARFQAAYDKVAVGLAAYIAEGSAANWQQEQADA